MAHAHVEMSSKENKALETKFILLKDEWQEATRYMSAISDIVMNTAYQRIIAMGFPAVPMILHEMSKEPDMWFWALEAITHEDPIETDHIGKIEEMTEDWLILGRQRGWI